MKKFTALTLTIFIVLGMTAVLPISAENYSALVYDSFTDGTWDDILGKTGTIATASMDNGKLKLTQTASGAMELFYSKVPVYKVGELGRRDVNLKLKLGKNDNGTVQNIYFNLGKADGTVALAGAQFLGTTMPGAIDYGKVSPISIQNTETVPATLALMKALPAGYDDGNFHSVNIVYNRTTTTAATCSLYWDSTPIYENYAFTMNNTADMVLMLRMLPAGAGIRRPGWTEVTSWVDDLSITQGTPLSPTGNTYQILAREKFSDSTWTNNFTKYGANINAEIVDQSLNLTQQEIVNMNHIYAKTPVYKAYELGRREVIFDLKLGSEVHNIFVQIGKSDATAASSVGACFLGTNIANAADYGKVLTAISITSDSYALPAGFGEGFHNVKLVFDKTSETTASCSLYWDKQEMFLNKVLPALPTGTDLYALIRGIPGNSTTHRYPNPTLDSSIKNFVMTSGLPYIPTALQAKITEVQGLAESDYIYGWATFQSALTTAQTLVGGPITESEEAAAITALNNAINGLVLKYQTKVVLVDNFDKTEWGTGDTAGNKAKVDFVAGDGYKVNLSVKVDKSLGRSTLEIKNEAGTIVDTKKIDCFFVTQSWVDVTFTVPTKGKYTLEITADGSNYSETSDILFNEGLGSSTAGNGIIFNGIVIDGEVE